MRLPNALKQLLIAGLLAATIGAAQAQITGIRVPTGPTAVADSLPDLGSSANAALSRDDEYQIGRMMMRDLRSQNAILDDPETADYLQALGSRVTVEAQDGQQTFSFFAVRDKSINAFALPGGFIGLNTGLILLTDSESELAGVIAHEVGHVVQRHIARAVQAQAHSNLTTMATMLGAVLIGAVTGNANALPGIIAVGQGAAMQQQINFTRMEETEADRVGIGYMAAAGFDPNGMAAFFSTMMRQRGTATDMIPVLLMDHPIDETRIAEARARIAGLSAYQRRPESASYAYIRERLRVETGSSNSDLRRYYEHARSADPENGALQYGAALAELKYGDPKVAVGLLAHLVKTQPELSLLRSALGQAQMAAGNTEAAHSTFDQALALSPRNVPLTVRYAEVLMQTGEARKAHVLLLDLFNKVMPTPEQIRLIALAASAAGDTADAYSYMAELHVASGDLMLATTQLDMALNTPGINDVQRKRFRARRDELAGYVSEQRHNRVSRTD